MRLDRVDVRSRLKPRRDPYWTRLSEGRALGYRKMAAGSPGTWSARFYDGTRNHQKSLGAFDSLDERQRFDAAKQAAEE